MENPATWDEATRTIHEALRRADGARAEGRIGMSTAGQVAGALRAGGLLLGEGGVVYELSVKGTHRRGLFRTLEGAKAAAQARLDEYWELRDSSTDEENESYEPMTTRRLEWIEQQHFLGGPTRGDRRFPFYGGPMPTAWFSESSYFLILEREVGL